MPDPFARSIVPAAAVDLQSPGRRDYYVRLEHPSIWGHYLVPLTVVVGPDAAPGQGLVAIGATHGNEYEGPVAIKRLLADLDVAAVRGRLVLIPVLNVSAFAAARRDTPEDGGNLNRAFPGDPRGSLTSRFAALISQQIFPHVHVVLDIHSGGRVARFPHLMSFHHLEDPEQRRRSERLARGFGAPFTMIYQNQTPGLLTSTAEALGKITLGAEVGWGAAVHADGVSMTMQGIRYAMSVEGIVATPPPALAHVPPADQVLADTSAPACSLLAPWDGIFEPLVQLGAFVTAGQVVAQLHDFQRLDEPPLVLRAPHAGPILCQAWEAEVKQGQVITQVGQVTAWMA